MLKQSAINRIIISSTALLLILLLSIFPSKKESLIESSTEIINNETLEVFALDKNNILGKIKILKNKSTEDLIFYIINSLTINSSLSNLLPNGFSAIIPANTKLLNYSIKDNILTLNFNENILNSKNFEKIIESLTFTFCNQENIKGIQILINGNKITKSHNTNIIIPDVITKEYGINKEYDITNITGISKTIIYYNAKLYDESYLIPITKINNSNDEKLEIIIQEMQRTPIQETNLISYLTAAYELENYEILENTINVSFNNHLLTNLTDNTIIEEVKYTLAESIKDSYSIENVTININ